MDRIVRKTPKGDEELQTRIHGLERPLRHVLILVDGRSTVDELVAKGEGMENVVSALEALANQGYVAIGEPTGGEGEIDEVKQRLIAIARELLGADAGKIVSMLEAAPNNREGLLEASGRCKKLISLTIDETKAELLMRRCRAVLDAL